MAEPKARLPEIVSQESTVLRGAAEQTTASASGSNSQGAPPTVVPEAPHRRTLGSYSLLEKLGEGGMGTVYKAQHERLKKTVALKMLPARFLDDSERAARFQREMEAAGRLEHPNLVRAMDAGEVDGIHFLVMEYVQGTDLARLVAERGRLPLGEACLLIRQAAEALKYAHGRGLVHRDIKPSNIMWTDDNCVKVLDMGLACFRGDGPFDENQGLTETGAMLGTIDYMSPEQQRDAKGVDGRADVYSLGCTLHFLLTGTPVYQGNRIERLLAHHQEPIPTLCGRRSDVPPDLDALYGKMIAKRPEDRYDSMEQLLTGLDDVIRRLPGRSESTGAPAVDSCRELEESGFRKRSFWKRPFAAASLFVSLILSATILFLDLDVRSPDRTKRSSLSVVPTTSASVSTVGTPVSASKAEPATTPGARRAGKPDSTATRERVITAADTENSLPSGVLEDADAIDLFDGAKKVALMISDSFPGKTKPPLFVTAFRGTAGSHLGLAKQIMDELKAVGFTIDPDARIQLSGRLLRLPLRDTEPLAGFSARCTLWFAEGREQNFSLNVKSRDDGLAAVGETGELVPPPNDTRPSDSIQLTPSIEGTEIHPSGGSPYSVQILRETTPGQFAAIEPYRQGDLLFVDLPKSCIYAVKVGNATQFDMVASLYVDGLSRYAMADDPKYRNGLDYIPANGERTLKGFYRNGGTVDSFQVGEYSESPAGKTLPPAPETGAITVTFATCWTGDQKPPGEPGTKSPATSAGPPREDPTHVVQRKVGKIRSIVKVRFAAQ